MCIDHLLLDIEIDIIDTLIIFLIYLWKERHVYQNIFVLKTVIAYLMRSQNVVTECHLCHVCHVQRNVVSLVNISVLCRLKHIIETCNFLFEIQNIYCARGIGEYLLSINRHDTNIRFVMLLFMISRHYWFNLWLYGWDGILTPVSRMTQIIDSTKNSRH